MKKLILLLFAFSSLVASSQPTIPITKSMLDNPTKMKLSELVDNITFVRLETNKESLVKYTRYAVYSKDFMFFEDRVFSWDGKWKANIGKDGRGPYEEIGGMDNIAFKGGKFYSKGGKLLEFDINGMPTKKVRYLQNEPINNHIGSTLRNAIGQITFAGKYLFLNAIDAAYFINPDNFQTELRIELIPNKIINEKIDGNMGIGNISYYCDNILYCNPFIDSVFYVKDKSLQPMWKLNIDTEIKFPLSMFHKFYDYLTDMGRGGNILLNMREGKAKVMNVYETNNYLFINLLRFVSGISNSSAPNYILCYDKKQKTSKVVRAEDFVDDILGLGAYELKIFDEKIIMALWPHEVLDRIAKKKKAGEKISPRLAALAEQISEGDNPIVFIAHLKK